MSRPQPLASIRSFKAKWSIIVVVAIGLTAVMSQVGLEFGWPWWVRLMAAITVGLSMVQFLAHGTTYPLRDMAQASEAMAGGDYSVRVAPAGKDEVGQLIDTFNLMARNLAEADRSQREFIANASHELRTPVAAIRSTLENIVDGVVPAENQTLAKVLVQTEHLSDLVSQLLDLSRLESGAETVKMVPLDLGDLLHSIEAEARLNHPAIELELKAPLGLKVIGDELRLRQVFTNIVANAVRFAPLGSPITVVAGHQNCTARIAIQDLGPGISDEQKGRVFERFWQADRFPTGGGGAGLGLAICSEIIDQHGGRISIEDNSPRGTSVVVELKPMN